jgi:hypothetical protein
VPPSQNSTTISGIIGSVRDYGAVLLVLLDEGDRVIPLVFDRKAFQSLLDAEGCTAGDLVGMKATCEGNTLRFLKGQA